MGSQPGSDFQDRLDNPVEHHRAEIMDEFSAGLAARINQGASYNTAQAINGRPKADIDCDFGGCPERSGLRHRH
jgi:hypothetical protein